jgi:uncharacterized protein (TIGR02246 family)
VPVDDSTPAVADEKSVRDVHRRYAMAIDRHDASAYAATFTPNGTLVSSTGQVTTGRDALYAFARGWIEAHAGERTEHSCTDHQVISASGSITSTCSATITVIVDGTRSILFHATYRDVIVRCDTEWLIERRVVSVRSPVG